jgi:HlyD family secretion protein
MGRGVVTCHLIFPVWWSTVVTADELAKVRQVKLYPGMPVDAAIITGKRTMLAFLHQPFTDSFAHAFREE